MMFFGGLNLKWIIIGVAGMVVISFAGYFIHLQNKVNSLEVKNTTLEFERNHQKQTIDYLREVVRSHKIIRDKLGEDISSIDEESKRIIQDLETKKRRLSNAALKKPGLIESRVNRSTSTILRSIKRATGSKTDPTE